MRHEIVTKRNPYDVLGVNASVSNDELRTHYRRLVLENHPDKLMARGVPKEFVAIATEKVFHERGLWSDRQDGGFSPSQD